MSEIALGAALPSLPRPSRALWWVLLAALLLSVVLGLFVGRGTTSSDTLGSMFITMRAQRVLVAFFCGGGLSVAGAVVQSLFRNPLASPGILGTAAGAILGAHVAMLLVVLVLGGTSFSGFAPELMVPFGAILGAGLSLFVLLSVVSLSVNPLLLLLTGFALMSLFQSVSAFLTSMFQESWELNRALAMIERGSISAAGPKQVLLAVVMVLGGVLPALSWSSSLDLLLCGEEEARAFGVDVKRVRFWLVLWVAVITAGAVSVGGGVGFVGLIVPHALRPFAGQAHRYLIPASFLAGGVFLVLSDVLCRSLPLVGEIPLGVVADLIGAPVFMRMLVNLARTELGNA